MRRPVHPAVPDQTLQADHVYLAPLGASVSVVNSSLRIDADFHGPEVFDGFLSSLAADQNERAIGAVFSTEHRHGQLGLQAIQGAGGLALGHLSWRSETGSLRREQAPDDDRLSETIPARVQQHLVESQRTRQSGVPRPPSHAPKILGRSPRIEELSRNLHSKANSLGHEKTLLGLCEHLDALLHDPRKSHVRAWVPRCGTGQRAYALAMLMLERQPTRAREHRIQVFGSDSDEQALAIARAGRYPQAAVAELSPDRRQRFFVDDDGDVQVSLELRNSVLFALHDVFHSPPLTRIDLLSAGHMLARCPAELRSSLLETFHYALRRGGFLLVEPEQRSQVPHELFELINADCGLFRAHRFVLLEDKARRHRKQPERNALPASRSELTALAEELRGVSAQRLQDLEVLDRTHSDLNNFVEATGIRAFICDRELRITRASKALDDWLGDGVEPGTLLEDISHLIPGGRQLVVLAESVQRSGKSQERMHQVGTPPRAYLIHLHPCRDQRGSIDGVVTVFTDVSALEDARAIATRRERQQAAVAELGLAALNVPSSDLAEPPYELYGRALDMLADLLGGQRGFILEQGHDMRALLLRASRHPEPFRQRASSPVVFLREGGPLAQALTAPGAVRLSAPRPGDALLALVGGSHVPGGVACPLRVGESVYGLLAICTDVGDQLALEDLHFVQALANVLAGAMGRQRARRRLALEREVGLIVAEVDSVPRLGRRLRKALADTVGIDGLELWIAAQRAEEAELRRLWPESGAPSREAEPEPSRELERTFIKSRSSWRIRFDESRVETEITFPVLLGKKSIGAVRCHGSEPIAVDDELLAGLERMGHAVGDFLHWMRVDAARRESEQRSRTQSAELESIYATLPVGLATYDRELNPLRINERFRELEASAQRETMLTESVLRQVVETGVAVRDIELTTHSEAGPRSWLCSFAPVQDTEGEVAAVSSVVQDITERKRNEQSLRDADRQKDEFLVMLSHELRNPLAAIRNATELLGLREHSPDVARLHRVLDRQTEHMAKLIGGLLDVSRIMRGKLFLERTSTDLVRLLRGVCHDRASQLEQHQLTLQFDAPDSPVWVDGDPVRLVQIFDNLLANAVKFTPDAGSIRLGIDVREASAMVSIEDNGIGIEPDLLPHIFEPFRQAEQSASRSLGGMGLGLSLVRGLVELHGGVVSAESRGSGQGSTFRVELALAEVAGRPATIRPPRVTSLRVVIIEDNVDMAETLADLLRLSGHDVVGLAGSGEEGLECVLRVRPQIVLCDLGLPGQLDGLDVARSIRQKPELGGTQIVAVTGYGDQAYRRRANEAGFDACLIKPVTLEALQKQLERSAQKLG